MKADDQRHSLIDYVRFILAAPAPAALQPEMSAVKRAHQRLMRSNKGSLEESLSAMRLVDLIYNLRDIQPQPGQ